MPENKKWTLMFYFASDNPLAISVISQLKALKAAGYHKDVNVVAQFDPYTEGTPTHVFDVNLIKKLAEPAVSDVGFCENVPVIRNMIEDKLWGEERTNPTEDGANPQGELIRTALHDLLESQHPGFGYAPPQPPFGVNGFIANGDGAREPNPEDSLREFLRFCARKYPADHYILFMLGHGVVVGNDIFMLDEHTATESSLTLTALREILDDFHQEIEGTDGELELISFQSCSVSSVEVAFQLQGYANFMLASQGPTFVGSWPYREILIRFFNEMMVQNGDINIRELLLTIYKYCLYNSTDYLLAGYSFQGTLCDLTKMGRLKLPIQNLSLALIAGLNDFQSKNFILLSHWKSQSFFNEMYTDLYDFCFCFNNLVVEFLRDGGELTQAMQAIYLAGETVMDKLVKENPKKPNDPIIEQIIVAADSLGPAYQYSRGLSIYFPWQEPSRDRRIMIEYENYQFNFDGVSWLAFLRAYFNQTMREVSKAEPDPRRFLPLLNQGDTLDEDLASLVYSGEGTLDGSLGLLPPMLKGDPTDKTGGDAECVSIKNYPRDVRSRRARRRQANQTFPLIEGFSLFNLNGNNNGNGNNGNGNRNDGDV